MKWLDAKRDRSPIENKMGSGPAADKSEPSSSERAPAVSGSPGIKEPDATPAAARLANESGVDLGLIKGTGAGGRITVTDVEASVEATKNNQGSGSSEPEIEES